MDNKKLIFHSALHGHMQYENPALFLQGAAIILQYQFVSTGQQHVPQHLA